MVRRFVSICLWYFLPYYCIEAQWLSLPFDRITIEDGLPNPSVLNIIQDQQGFMWIGTLNGIVRYDGYQLQTYRPVAGPVESLPERDLPVLFQDNQGRIWLGLAYQKTKLFCYDPATDRFRAFPLPKNCPQLYDNPISSFLQDQQGKLWLGTLGNGLFRMDVLKWQPGQSSDNISIRHYVKKYYAHSNEINGKLYEDANGHIWMPTDGGLYRLNPKSGEWKQFKIQEEPGSCFDLVFEAPQTLWLGASNGLFKFNLKTFKSIPYRHKPLEAFSLGGTSVYKLATGPDGRLWLVHSNGIDIFDRSMEQFYHIQSSAKQIQFEFQRSTTLFADYSGNMWVGAWRNGLYRYNPGKGKFQFFRPDYFQIPNTGAASIWNVYEDSRQALWLGTGLHGLVCWDRKRGSIRKHQQARSKNNNVFGNFVMSAVEDSTGNLWLGNEQGLERLDYKTGAIQKYSHLGFSKGYPWISKKGDFWVVGQKQGLCRILDLDKGLYKSFPLDGVTCIKEDDKGMLWIGINQNGLYRLDPDTDSLDHFIPQYGIQDIHFDRQGQCWLATHSYGLVQFDPKTESILPLKPAVQEQVGLVRAITEDHQGFLWMANPNGLVQFDPKNRRVLRLYSKHNWLQAGDTWFGMQLSACQTADGNLAFSCPAGLLLFDPRSLKPDLITPKAAFTEFKLFNKKINPGEGRPLQVVISQTKKIELLHWQNSFSLTFAALHFKSSEDNTYLYRLTPYEKEWQNAGFQRDAAYTNLSPGRYILQVKAANCDGVYSSKPIELLIHIQSPWWARWWAYLLYALSLVGIIYAVYRFQLRRKLEQAEKHRLEELDSVKTRLYTNITHEFRTPLTIILGLAGQLKSQAGGSLKSGLEMIRRNGRQLLLLVNQMLELASLESGHLKLRPVQGDVIGYLRYLLESFHSLAKSKNIELHFQAPEEHLLMDYDMERLQTVVSNLLSNAIKFSPKGGKVWLEVEQLLQNQTPVLQIKVRDTGPGIPEDKIHRIFERFYQMDDSSTRAAEGTGIGLTLSSELIKLMGGSISANSKPGKGAEFVVHLPITRNAEKQEATITQQEIEVDPDHSKILPPTQPSSETPGAYAKGKPTILIIEDNPDVVHYLHSCLNGRYRILIAADGKQGITRALETVPDLIVSDVMMPHKDGFEVCHTLKTDERSSHIPIILLTAKADIQSRLTGLQRGADAYLSKPFHPEELLTRIKNLLDLRQKLQAHYLALTDTPTGSSALAPEPEDVLEHDFIQKVTALIQADYQKQWQVPELAARLYISDSQLHRKLEALTGKHTTEFMRFLRLKKAKQLLREQPKAKVSAIAYDVGFSNAQEFSRRFKELFGLTPGTWQKMER